MKKIGVMTSGGDAPGMNAAIRGITRMAINSGLEVYGFQRGWQGVIDMVYRPLNRRSVSNTLQRGGTILGSSRCREFREEAGRHRAAEALNELEIDALFVIGGNGSLRGAHELGKIWSGQIIGVPGTIDNDCGGTDWTIGFFTAVDTALDAIDKIRDTADAFERIFIVEVMGRNAGDIALGVGVTGGAEEILIPEVSFDLKEIARSIVQARDRGKRSYIIVVAEGAAEDGAERLARDLEEESGLECRPVVLGHIQRGGSPVAWDRWLATELGAFAVESAVKGATGVMAGKVQGKLVLTPFEEIWDSTREFDPYLLHAHRLLV